MDLHQEEEVEFEEKEEEVGRPEYRSINMNMNINQNRRQSKQITVAAAAAAVVVADTPPFLSSTPLPPLFLPSLSMPTRPMPTMSMPIPSKLFRSGNSTSTSIKEQAVSSTLSISRPHYRWSIRELQELPSDYRLVRTNVYVTQEGDKPFLPQPQQVADRICHTLKALSITIIHDDDHHPMIAPNSSNPFIDSDEGSSGEEENILFVETQYDVKFAIRLFASSNSNSNSNSKSTMIVVEIRRTSGCTLEFREAAKTLLRSVVAVTANANTNANVIAQQEQRTTIGGGQGGALTKTKRRTFTLPESLPKRSQEDFHQCIHDDFHIAYKMIHSPKYETQVFGLESLEQLTRNKGDETNENDQVVKTVVARFVLLGKGGEEGEDDDNDNCNDCLKQLLLLLDTTSTTTTDLRSRTSQQYQQSSFSSSLLLRRKVFTVLANSLEALHNSINNSTPPLCTTYSNTDRSVFLQMKQPSFLSVLVSSVQEMTPQRPHDVFQAVRCVRYLHLLTSSSITGEKNGVVRTAMKKIHPTALDILSSYACGGNDNDNCNGGYHHHHYHHEGLQQESSMLLVQLQQQQKTLMMRSS